MGVMLMRLRPWDGTPGRHPERGSGASTYARPATTQLTALQRTAGNRAVCTLLGPDGRLAVQRDFSQETPVPGGDWIKKWRMKVKGSVGVTADGTTTKQPVVENMEFESGSGGDVDIAVTLEVTWDEWKKTWPWGDYGWNSGSVGDLPFEYKAFWKGKGKNGAMDVAFVSSTDTKLDMLDIISMYEAKPSASGDTAVITLVAYRGGNSMEATIRIKLKPPARPVTPGPTWVDRSLVIDGFPRNKATIAADNLKKIEDFWYSLTPETRTAIQNNQLLNGLKVRISGHTSNTDKVPHNFDLGYSRAQSVETVLRKLSGNKEATNFAPMSKGERGIATDDPGKEQEDAAQRKVVIELWEEHNPVSTGLRKLLELFGGSAP